jgi:hypothetical protein
MEQRRRQNRGLGECARMSVLKRTVLVVVLAAIVTMLAAPAAQATVRIYVGKGVGKARLGMVDTTAMKYLGSHQPMRGDTDYNSRVVYVVDFGKKSSGRYALEMLSNKSHKVFQFACNRAKYVTAKGIKVGSTESLLKSKYGSKLKRNATQAIYTRYTLGKHPYTRFWVKKSTARVYQIIVAK